MTDRREKILARLVEIMETITGVVSVYRNCPDPIEARMPAVVVFDADEEIAPLPDTARYKGPTAPQVMVMRPEVFVVLSARAADAGTRLNELRARIYKAVITDEALSDIVGTNGRISLEAGRSGFAVGRAMSSELKLEFGFTYVLRASDL
jgi:hypothetical protein